MEHFFVSYHSFPDIVYISREFVTLKMSVKVIMYNNCNGAIQWLVLTSIKVVLDNFLLALTVFQILYIYSFPEIVWPCKFRSRSWCTKSAVVPFDRKYMISYLMAIAIIALSLTVCKIFDHDNLTLKMKVKN